ncbi:hypothetical protein FOA52_008669 [Chlamydomonas sp. UWO 241]|nr:hypothetical protein FOA52_008669 [Chlamydomonas sp. UWO 241]
MEIISPEADALVSKAERLLRPSILAFRFSADLDAAAPLLERAGYIYRSCQASDKAISAFERAAGVQEKLGGSGGKLLEACAEVARSSGDFSRAAAYVDRAADAYCSSGRVTAGADALSRGGRLLEGSDPLASAHLYARACGIWEEEEKEALGLDVFRACASAYVRAGRSREGAQALERLARACSNAGSSNSMQKAQLGAVVAYLHAADGVAAWGAFQAASSSEGAGGEELGAAEALLMAYRSGSEDAVHACVSSRAIFKLLDNGAARLAFALPVGDMAAMAGQVEAAMGVASAGGGGGSAPGGGDAAGGGAEQEEADELL